MVLPTLFSFKSFQHVSLVILTTTGHLIYTKCHFQTASHPQTATFTAHICGGVMVRKFSCPDSQLFPGYLGSISSGNCFHLVIRGGPHPSPCRDAQTRSTRWQGKGGTRACEVCLQFISPCFLPKVLFSPSINTP